MNIAVAITVNDRPEYLKQVIESWSAVRGIQDVPVIFQVEPHSPSLALCQDAPFADKTVIVNTYKKGALGNPLAALDSGFDLGANFVILGEDDSIVTADILEYFSYAAHAYERRPKCLAICSFQYRPVSSSFVIHQRHYFASVVWGTWRERWGQIRADWRLDYNPAWDRMLLDRVVWDEYCVFPGTSRSQHIGKYGGTHMQEADFETLQAKQVHDGSAQRYVALGGYIE